MERSTVELSADQQLVDDLHQVLGLLFDHPKQARLLIGIEVVPVRNERSGTSVDRRQWRAKLVRGRGDAVPPRAPQGVSPRRGAPGQPPAALELAQRRGAPPPP